MVLYYVNETDLNIPELFRSAHALVQDASCAPSLRPLEVTGWDGAWRREKVLRVRKTTRPPPPPMRSLDTLKLSLQRLAGLPAEGWATAKLFWLAEPAGLVRTLFVPEDGEFAAAAVQGMTPLEQLAATAIDWTESRLFRFSFCPVFLHVDEWALGHKRAKARGLFRDSDWRMPLRAQPLPDNLPLRGSPFDVTLAKRFRTLIEVSRNREILAELRSELETARRPEHRVRVKASIVTGIVLLKNVLQRAQERGLDMTSFYAEYPSILEQP